MKGNSLHLVRPLATFDNFVPKTEIQEKAKDSMIKLAESLLSQEAKITSSAHPFDHSRLFILNGPPGRGKTHLMESLINYIKERSPKLYAKLFYTNYNLTYGFMSGLEEDKFEGRPVALWDDIFADKNKLSELTDCTDVMAFCNFIMKIYESRRLVIVSSNFDILRELIPRAISYDVKGRVKSRAAELVARSFEIMFDGPDHRTGIKIEDPFQF